MRNKIILGILVLYTIGISVLFIINGKKLSASEGINAQHEITIDSLETHALMVEKRIPVRDLQFDSLGLILISIHQSLNQVRLEQDLASKRYLNIASSLATKSDDSLLIIALKDTL